MRPLTCAGLALALAIGVAAWSAPAHAQAPATAPGPATVIAGSANFDQYCVVCHGKDAKGTGPLAATLKPKPANLTELSLRNGGTFPTQLVFDTIDGKKKVKGHGGGDMPEWGDAFQKSAKDGATDTANARIETLVQFLATIQVK